MNPVRETRVIPRLVVAPALGEAAQGDLGEAAGKGHHGLFVCGQLDPKGSLDFAESLFCFSRVHPEIAKIVAGPGKTRVEAQGLAVENLCIGIVADLGKHGAKAVPDIGVGWVRCNEIPKHVDRLRCAALSADGERKVVHALGMIGLLR